MGCASSSASPVADVDTVPAKITAKITLTPTTTPPTTQLQLVEVTNEQRRHLRFSAPETPTMVVPPTTATKTLSPVLSFRQAAESAGASASDDMSLSLIRTGSSDLPLVQAFIAASMPPTPTTTTDKHTDRDRLPHYPHHHDSQDEDDAEHLPNHPLLPPFLSEVLTDDIDIPPERPNARTKQQLRQQHQRQRHHRAVHHAWTGAESSSPRSRVSSTRSPRSGLLPVPGTGYPCEDGVPAGLVVTQTRLESLDVANQLETAAEAEAGVVNLPSIRGWIDDIAAARRSAPTADVVF